MTSMGSLAADSVRLNNTAMGLGSGMVANNI